MVRSNDDNDDNNIDAAIDEQSENHHDFAKADTTADRRNQQQSSTRKRLVIEDEGVYIPPAKRRQLEQQQQEQNDDNNIMDSTDSISIQRQTWQDQKRIVHGTINRLNAGTIKPLIHDLFDKVNLIRLRGVFTKSLVRAAVVSANYSHVYAATAAVIHSKLPEIGELLVKRLVLAFRKSFKFKEKRKCTAVCMFLIHLFHQSVIHELMILQILAVLLDGYPTDDSVQVAIQILTTAGGALQETTPTGVRAVSERLRGILHEGQLSRRVEYELERLFELLKTKFRNSGPAILPELDLVEDQITLEMSLDDEDIAAEEELDIFNVDPEYEQNETVWKQIRAEVLGLDGSDDDDGESETDDDEETDEDEEEQDEDQEAPDQELAMVPAASTVVQDLSEADLVHLRRTIYLTIMSSATFEECTHKLTRVSIPDGREEELINMLIECCSQERTFLRYYGSIAARFCLLHDRWRDAFSVAFSRQYSSIHRLETNKLRNVAKLFAHLLHTDSLPWNVLQDIHMNERETTSSSRIFCKILVQDMAEAIGIAELKKRFTSSDWYQGMFPTNDMRDTRYAINFYTSIGLGPLTDGLREYLKNAPKMILAQAQAAASKKDDSDDDSASSESSSSSSTVSSSSTGSSTTSSSSTGSSTDSYTSSSSSSSYSSRGRRRSSRRGRRSKRSRSESSSYSSSSGSSSGSSSSGSSSSPSRRHCSRSPVDRKDKGDRTERDRDRTEGDRNRTERDDRKQRDHTDRTERDRTADRDVDKKRDRTAPEERDRRRPVVEKSGEEEEKPLGSRKDRSRDTEEEQRDERYRRHRRDNEDRRRHRDKKEDEAADLRDNQERKRPEKSAEEEEKHLGRGSRKDRSRDNEEEQQDERYRRRDDRHRGKKEEAPDRRRRDNQEGRREREEERDRRRDDEEDRGHRDDDERRGRRRRDDDEGRGSRRRDGNEGRERRLCDGNEGRERSRRDGNEGRERSRRDGNERRERSRRDGNEGREHRRRDNEEGLEHSRRDNEEGREQGEGHDDSKRRHDDKEDDVRREDGRSRTHDQSRRREEDQEDTAGQRHQADERSKQGEDERRYRDGSPK